MLFLAALVLMSMCIVRRRCCGWPCCCGWRKVSKLKAKVSVNFATVRVWERFVRAQLRLAFKRKAWHFMGTHLRMIKDRTR